MKTPPAARRGETSVRSQRALLPLRRHATARCAAFALAAAWLCATSRPCLAQVASDYAVQVSATAQKVPPKITLAWPSFPSAGSYNVYRKTYGDTTWGAAIATLPAAATGYTDNAVSVGARYEYQVYRGSGAYGYLASGIEATLVEDRGKVVLVVDDTYAASLVSELSRLQDDLVGDGWTVLRHDVSRTASVPSVKAVIQAEYNADPVNVRAVFLFGHVPVPYSGDIAPDGHANHVGAWPADMYYGNMTGTWTDTQDFPGSQPGRQSNHPGDGKFDQSSAPSDIDLEVGRVDLQNMPAFAPKTELDLLRQYLDKDHNFRHKLITAQPRGLIDDNFGAFGGEAFASTGWRAFSAFFGASNVFALDWFTTLNNNSYLWAYGCGGGSYTSAGGVGSTSNFAATDTKTVFTMLFGSYHGDWDVQNNFLRAPLATTTYGLTCAWAGRPPWYFHHMGMGEEIGYSTRLTQNNVGLYWYSWGRSIHIALMGDPTLRMHAVAPVSALTTSPLAGGVSLSWTASPDTVAGYHVYRAAGPAGPFTRATASLVAGTTYQDTGIPAGTYTYMVRAVKLETSASGSYFNPSQGIFAAGTALPPVPAARVFVSPAGNDGNDCSGAATPCQSVAAAVGQVAAGGEVIIEASGSYGGATIGKAVTIDAAGGVAAFFGQAITVAAGPGDAVVLRGLISKAAVPGTGTGILYSSGGSLFVESCVVNGWATGIAVSGGGFVSIKDTRVRNATSVAVSVASAGARVTIDRTRLEGNAAGLSVAAGAFAAARASVASGNAGAGLAANGGTLEIDGCLVASNGIGVSAGPAAGAVRISASVVTENATGLAQAGASVLLSRGDNTVAGNATDVAGTLGSFSQR
jgi:hypothetical protein